MIYKIQQYKFICDNCSTSEIFYNGYLKYYEEARKKGWAVSRNKTSCYCPNCAPWYRNAGKKTALIITPEIEKRRKLRKEIIEGRD